MFSSGNPALNDHTFTDAARGLDTRVEGHADVMTVEGTANRTMVLLALAAVPAYLSWNALPAMAQGLWIGGAIAGFVLSLITIFKASWSPFTAPLYAIAEGLFLGAFSRYFESFQPGIVVQAMGLTFAVLFCMLVLYRTGVIKVTQKFQAIVLAAGAAIFLVYLLNFILGFFMPNAIPFVHDTGALGIAFSGAVVVVAALFLLLDFEFIVQGTRAGAPKYMEWYGAFGLMVTLVWLYISLLRLLAKLRSE